ncbi:Protein YIPF1-like protein [Diplonema papillatum]|nr:Protein YIPF1-like protein [Diplonema papillatum]
MSNANPYSAEANLFVGMAVHAPSAPPPQAEFVAPPQPAVDPFASNAEQPKDSADGGLDWGHAELAPFANATEDADKDFADSPDFGFYSTTGDRGAKQNVGFEPQSWDEANVQAAPSSDQQQQPQQQQQKKGQQPPPPPLDGEEEADRFEKTSKCWKLGFYQQFFDVDTEHVAARLIDSFVVTRRPDYLPAPQDVIVPAIREEGETRATPPALPLDMYGPLWVSTTLWIALAVFGYLATQLDASTGTSPPPTSAPIEHTPAPTESPSVLPTDSPAVNASPVPDTVAPLLFHAFQALSDGGGSASGTGKDVPQWVFDFSWVLMSIAVSYCYVIGAPVLLWLLLHWLDVKISLPSLVSLFGYGVTPLIATAAVCIVPIGIVRWAAAAVGSTYTFAVIGSLLYNYCPDMSSQGKLTVLGGTALAHYVASSLLFFQILKI